MMRCTKCGRTKFDIKVVFTYEAVLSGDNIILKTPISPSEPEIIDHNCQYCSHNPKNNKKRKRKYTKSKDYKHNSDNLTWPEYT